MSNTSLFTCQGASHVVQSHKGVLLVRAVLPAPYCNYVRLSIYSHASVSVGNLMLKPGIYQSPYFKYGIMAAPPLFNCVGFWFLRNQKPILKNIM